MKSNYYIISISIILTLLVTSVAMAAEQPVSIHNDKFKVSFENGKLSIADTKSGKNFAIVAMEGIAGQVKVENAKDKTFGRGWAIDISDANGGGRVMLFPELPFVLIKLRVTNPGTETKVLNKIPVASITVDLAKPAGSLKGFGTGGITGLEDNKGSYMWQAIVDPQSRNGVVGGWITTERGSGVVFAGLTNNQACMTAQVEYGRLRIGPGRTEELETFAIGYFDDARFGMEAWAGTIAKVLDIKLPPLPTVYCTWYHAGSSDEKKLPVQAEFAAKNFAPFGFSVVQIDDGWQDGQTKNGPRKNFTQVKPDGPYKSGMKATAEKIRALGLVPAIWLMPFSGSHEDPWYRDHRGWFVKRDDGTPHESAWGGTALDMTNPEVLKYLREEIHRIVKEWGYGYLKMDGLCSGAAVNHCYVNDVYKDDKIGDAVLSNPDKTNIEAYRDGLRLIRKTAGRDTFILGCCTPQNMRSYGGPFGLIDAMRIGPDNGTKWSGIRTGPIYGARNYHLHGRIWYNDPDPLYVRKSLSLDQARAICSWVTISGQLSASSDSYADLTPDRVDILKRTMPSHNLRPRPVDLFEENVPQIWLLSDQYAATRRDVVGLFNWDDKKDLVIDRSLENIGLSGQAEYMAYEYWSNKLLGPFKGNLKQTLAPASCAVLSLKPVTDHPQLISTSRHITQGIVDVVEEKWDVKARELSGISKVVAGDDYELRIITAASEGACKAVSAEISAKDQRAGVTVSMK
ncbi:MAG: alpha-galactosidase, partial [Kiritimatiellae bacterium]|nr:alpha-galactosidase [Kiritimatiellia bacterium]